MSPTSMATARFMETWAHALDVAEALGVDARAERPGPARGPPRRADPQLRVRVHRLAAPAEEFRVELTLPTGDAWEHGPADAAQRCAVRRTTSACGSPSGATATTSTWSPPDRSPTVARHRPGLRRPARWGRWTDEPTMLRIGNCSGFYGDRLSAMREMLEGGPVDVVTGDYLAELTMLILGKDQLKDPSLGYARTFVTQVAGLPRARAGEGRQDRLQRRWPQPCRPGREAAEVAEGLGLSPKIAWVDGDNLLAARR